MRSPRHPGPTGSLALALYHRWESERFFVIVTFYIDESGTHGSGVTILGAWIGRLGQWAAFDPEWKKLLKRNGLTYFHSKEMRHSENEFRGWDDRRKGEFMDKAAQLALKHLEFGFTVDVTDDHFKDHYVAGNRPKGVPLDSKYGLCFRHSLSAVVPMALEAFKGRNLDINFVLEQSNYFGGALKIFNEVKYSKESDDQHIAKLLRTCTPGDKKEFPGLQAADVNAYSTFQHHTRSPQELEIAPTSYKEAKKLRKVPIYHFPLKPDTLEKYKVLVLEKAAEKEARRKKPSLSSSGR